MRKHGVRIARALFAAVALVCLAVPSAHATLVGDLVEISFDAEVFDLTTGPAFVPVSLSVQHPSGPLGGFIDEAYSLILDDGTILIRYSAKNFSRSPFEYGGFVVDITDLDWIGTPGVVSSFNQVTNVSGITTSFTDDSLRIVYDPFTLEGGEGFHLQARFEFESNHDVPMVPEPATLSLLSFGLAGLGFWQSKRD